MSENLPDFTKNSCPENSNVVDTHRSPHEILRRAIDALEPGEQIVLSVQVAMSLIMEWGAAAPEKDARIARLLEMLDLAEETIEEFKQTRGRHDGEHDSGLTVCSKCNESYVLAEAKLDALKVSND